VDSIESVVRQSLAASLRRLQLPKVTLLQLHNGLTLQRGEEPFSLNPADVLGPGGVSEAFRKLRDEGLVEHLGLTGTGHPDAIRVVLHSGDFQTIQIPYNLLNPSAGRVMPRTFRETNYGNVLADCQTLGIGGMAIRVYAGGALLGRSPSAHTYKTPFFPLDLYQRDCERTERLTDLLGVSGAKELAVRFALSHSAIQTAIVGFATPEHIHEALTFAEAGPLAEPVLEHIADAWSHL
jgi:aryl-alcohol dehydrogenase-like predicted oxidoreductase